MLLVLFAHNIQVLLRECQAHRLFLNTTIIISSIIRYRHSRVVQKIRIEPKPKLEHLSQLRTLKKLHFYITAQRQAKIQTDYHTRRFLPHL